MLLSGKTVLITGASRGIGLAIAQTFAAQGASLILTGRNIDALNNIKDQLPYPPDHFTYAMDVNDRDSIKAVFDDLASKKILLDAVVNNAGIMLDSLLMMVKPEQVERTFETNVFGVINLNQFALKSFIRKKSGSIIHITSIVGTHGNAGQSVYSASKSAIIGLTRSLSKELAPLNIRVNAIAPGYIETDLTAGYSEEIKNKTIASIGMKRAGSANDVANTALFLASDLSAYVTGQIIGVDGGMII